ALLVSSDAQRAVAPLQNLLAQIGRVVAQAGSAVEDDCNLLAVARDVAHEPARRLERGHDRSAGITTSARRSSDFCATSGAMPPHSGCMVTAPISPDRQRSISSSGVRIT